EAPVAISLANRYKNRENHSTIEPITENPINPFVHTRRNTFEVLGIGGSNVPRVVADFSKRKIKNETDISDIGYFYDPVSDKWNMNDSAPDILFLGNNSLPFNVPNGLKAVCSFSLCQKLEDKTSIFPLLSIENFLTGKNFSPLLNFITVDLNKLSNDLISKIKKDRTIVLVLETDNLHGMAEQRRAFIKLMNNNIENPVIIKRDYALPDMDELRLYSATDLGALLIDGLGDGVWITVDEINDSKNSGNVYVKSFINKNESKEKIINRILFGILQAARVRISKTEYIA